MNHSKKPRVLVTGGAGYIGSHALAQLSPLVDCLIVLDNLSTGDVRAITAGEFVQGDIGDSACVNPLLKKHQIDTVFHFAALSSVEEAVRNPELYYENNAIKMKVLLEACVQQGVQYFIYSSTAAVYGNVPAEKKVDEDAECDPMNPYGRSKLAGEWLLKDLHHQMKFAILRYFNVAGVDVEHGLSCRKQHGTGFVKLVAEVATGQQEHVKVLGTDYPTADGTGVRDYIDVRDLVDAHVKALEYLRNGGESVILNCGYGHGYSVKEVIQAYEKILHHPLPLRYYPKRQGDPAAVIADNHHIKEVLHWEPQHDNLEEMIQSHLAWEQTKLKTS